MTVPEYHSAAPVPRPLSTSGAASYKTHILGIIQLNWQ